MGDVVGQEAITRTLLAALEKNRLGHAYLFTGPRGTGKTSTARILAKAINCLANKGAGEPDDACAVCREIDQGSFVDLIEIDAASNRNIDDIRELREKARFAPALARKKVYIIDEVHQLTDFAFNALLKTLEEPPPQTVFILATTDPQKVPLTIASRCQRFDFRRITPLDTAERLRQICTAEGFQVEDAALDAVAKAASGSLRDAANLLEQLVLSAGTTATGEDARALFGMIGSARGQQVAAAILRGDMAAALRAVNDFDKNGVDMRQVQREVVEELRALMLIKAGVPDVLDISESEVEERQALAEAADMSVLRAALERFASLSVPSGSTPLPLEMAIVGALTERRQAAPSPAPSRATHPETRRTAPPVEKATAAERPTPKVIREGVREQRPVAEERAAAQSVGPRAAERPSPAPQPAQPPAEKRPPVQTPGVPAPAQEAAVAPEGQAEADKPALKQPIPPGDILALQRRWNEVINSLKGYGSNRTLDTYLRGASRPLEFRGDTLVIGFFYKFQMDKIEDPKYKFLVERRLSEYFGVHYRIECILVERPRSRGHTVQAALERGAELEDPEQDMEKAQ